MMLGIAAHRFAQLLGGGGDVQRIVHHLEGKTDALGVALGGLHTRGIGAHACREASKLCRHADERTRFVGVEVEKLIIGKLVLLTEHIHNLPTNHAAVARGAGEQDGRLGAHLRGHAVVPSREGKGIHEHTVTREQSHRLTVHLMVGGSAAAQVVVVHAGEVVVDE